jgi:anaphase-promoting complex subunit 6
MSLHIACMYHLSHLNSKLFILAHEMVNREPENPISWYAVGVWYLSHGKWAQARQYFRCVYCGKNKVHRVDLTVAKHL